MRLPLNRNNRPTTLSLSDAPGDDLDRELAWQMSEGRRDALARFVDRHLGSLYKHLERRLGPGHAALIGSVVEATFRVAFRRMRPYVRGSARVPMRMWLLRLAGRELVRRKAITPPKRNDIESEELAELREAIALLPPRQGAAVSMALFEGMSAGEIAGALGVRQTRAMRLLRKALRRIGGRLALAHAEVS